MPWRNNAASPGGTQIQAESWDGTTPASTGSSAVSQSPPELGSPLHSLSAVQDIIREQKGGFVLSMFDLFWGRRWIQQSHLLWGNSEHIPAGQQWLQAPSHVMQLMALTCSTCPSAWQRLRLKCERVSVHKGLLKMRLGLSSQAKPSHIIRGMRKVMPTSRSRFQHTDPFSWPPKMQKSVQFGVYLYENSLRFCSMPWGCANCDRRGMVPAVISSRQGAVFCPASVITPFPT